MSHSMKIYYEEEETNFIYNGDLSGDVEIIVPNYRVDEDTFGNTVCKIPGIVLLDFVASWVRNQKIGILEEQSTSELLGLKEETHNA